MALTEEEFLAGDAAGTFVTKVAEITRLTRDVRGLRLRLLDPGSIRFTAGQFVTVEVPGTAATRAFSMASHLERLEAIRGRMPAWRSSLCCPSGGPAGPARPGS